MDIFIKTYPRDEYLLIYLLLSLSKFATGFRKIVLIKDPKDSLELPFVSKIPIEIREGPHFREEKGFSLGKGYYIQQILKLKWSDYTDADLVLQLDSDMLVTGPISPEDFLQNGKPIWVRRRWTDAGKGQMWKACMDRFTKSPDHFDFMAVPGFAFTRAAMADFADYIQAFTGRSIEEYWLQPDQQISEYEIFGNWLNQTQRHDYVILDWYPGISHTPHLLQRRSWSGATPEVREQNRAYTREHLFNPKFFKFLVRQNLNFIIWKILRRLKKYKKSINKRLNFQSMLSSDNPTLQKP